MQTIFKIIHSITILTLSAIILGSCSDMNELSDRFLSEGEIIYAAMVDTARIGSGEDAVKIEMKISTNRIKTVRIYWNEKNDSLDVQINNQTGNFTSVIQNLDERSYIFHLVSIDNYGNRSLIYELSGRALGENYKNSMLNRNISSIYASITGEKILKWGNIDTSTLDAEFNEVNYTDVEGIEKKRMVPIKESETAISDIQPGSQIKFRTLYIPDEMAVDTFYTEFKEADLKYPPDYPLLKSEWRLAAYSDEIGPGDNAAANAIDNNYDNRWHSSGSPYPHWLYIDLGGEVLISRVAAWPSVFDLSPGQTHDTRFPSKIKILVSDTKPTNHNDDSEFTLAGEFEVDYNKMGEHLFNLESPIAARYIKFIGTVPGSDQNFMVMGELDIYVR